MNAGAARPAPAREAWERRTAVPLVVVGVAFIVAYSVFVLAPELPLAVHSVLLLFLLVVWAVFFVDIVVRIALTPRGGRWRFAVTHPVDLLSALIPLFRAFRVLTPLDQIPYLRERTGNAVRVKFVVFALGYTVLFVFFVSLATLQAEREAPGASITSFGDAVWWAAVTIATVGYGDISPVTVLGRAYAVLLMVGGVAIIGVASATVVSLLNERIGALRHQGPGGREASPAERGDAPGGEGHGER